MLLTKIWYVIWYREKNNFHLTYENRIFLHMNYVIRIRNHRFKLSHVKCSYTKHGFYIWNGRFKHKKISIEIFISNKHFCIWNSIFICKMASEIFVWVASVTSDLQRLWQLNVKVFLTTLLSLKFLTWDHT